MSIYIPVGRQVSLALATDTLDGVGYGLDPAATAIEALSGPRLASQRFTRLLSAGANQIDSLFPDVGTELSELVVQGAGMNMGYLRAQFNFASQDALEQIQRDDADTITFGDMPADERIIGFSDLVVELLGSGAVITLTLVLASQDTVVVSLPTEAF